MITKFDDAPCPNCGAHHSAFVFVRDSQRTQRSIFADEEGYVKAGDGTDEYVEPFTFSVYRCQNCGEEVEMVD